MPTYICKHKDDQKPCEIVAGSKEEAVATAIAFYSSWGDPECGEVAPDPNPEDFTIVEKTLDNSKGEV